MPRVKGAWIWGGLFAVGLGYEVWTLLNRDRGDTLSEVVWRATDATPMVPLLAGVVAGHWWWPRKV